MNILPFVAGFLLFLACMTHALFQDTLALKVMQKQTSDLYSATRDVHNSLESASKKSQVKKGGDKKPSTPRIKKEKSPNEQFESKRDRPDICDIELAKFNLQILFSQDQPLVKKGLENLLTKMYQKAPFAKELGANYGVILANLLIEAGKKCGDDPSIENIYRHTDSKMQPILYTAIRGSGRYSSDFSVGYPPLHHFVRSDAKNASPIYFFYASRLVLESYFGQEIAHSILKKEEAQWSQSGNQVLKAEDLHAFLENSGHPDHLQVARTLISYQRKRSPLQVKTGFDANHQFYLEGPVIQRDE